MKSPGMRRNIQIEEVLYLMEWGISKRFEFIRSGVKSSKTIFEGQDALNNEHGRKVMTMTSNFEESAWRFWRQYEKVDIIFLVIDGNYIWIYE